MHIFHDWRAIPPHARGATVALGNFDGVHLGHAHLLRAAHSARPGAPLAVLTFEPHPRRFFRPDDPPFRLTLASERRDALAALGVQILYEIPFDATLSHMRAADFVTTILHQGIGAAHLACGPDFAFGHRRGGDVATLAAGAEALGMGLTIVAPYADARGPLSSSRIRRALQDGYPDWAAAELGRPWTIRGTVTLGDQRGRTIGFPTANVALGEHLEPARGVYAVRARLPDPHLADPHLADPSLADPSLADPSLADPNLARAQAAARVPTGRLVDGVANIGRRPTVAEGAQSRLEAHLFDYSGDLYGQEIAVTLLEFLRPEEKFADFAALRAQIVDDARAARQIHASRTQP
jgi:riboflavin kinase/FMN adenylyltransferase